MIDGAMIQDLLEKQIDALQPEKPNGRTLEQIQGEFLEYMHKRGIDIESVEEAVLAYYIQNADEAMRQGIDGIEFAVGASARLLTIGVIAGRQTMFTLDECSALRALINRRLSPYVDGGATVAELAELPYMATVGSAKEKLDLLWHFLMGEGS